MKIFFKVAFACAIALALAVPAKAQNSTTTTTVSNSTTSTTKNVADAPAQNVYVEFGGPGLTFSLNYDTRFTKRRDGIGGRLGVGYVAEDGNYIFSIPVQLNYLLGKNGKYFEVGGGATKVSFRGSDKAFLSFDENATVLGSMTFGYRWQPVDGGFNFRASFNPLFDSRNFVPFAGMSFGYTF